MYACTCKRMHVCTCNVSGGCVCVWMWLVRMGVCATFFVTLFHFAFSSTCELHPRLFSYTHICVFYFPVRIYRSCTRHVSLSLPFSLHSLILSPFLSLSFFVFLNCVITHHVYFRRYSFHCMDIGSTYYYLSVSPRFYVSPHINVSVVFSRSPLPLSPIKRLFRYEYETKMRKQTRWRKWNEKEM